MAGSSVPSLAALPQPSFRKTEASSSASHKTSAISPCPSSSTHARRSAGNSAPACLSRRLDSHPPAFLPMEAPPAWITSLKQTPHLVPAFVSKNHIPGAELPALIETVNASLGSLAAGKIVEPAPQALQPAVPVKK